MEKSRFDELLYCAGDREIRRDFVYYADTGIDGPVLGAWIIPTADGVTGLAISTQRAPGWGTTGRNAQAAAGSGTGTEEHSLDYERITAYDRRLFFGRGGDRKCGIWLTS